MSLDLKLYTIIDTTMPTYLQDILRQTDSVHLYFKKVICDDTITAVVVNNRVKIIRNAGDHDGTKSSFDISFDDDFSRTGNPLEVDLGESINFSIVQDLLQADNWTAEEAKYGPLNLRTARQALNANMHKKTFHVGICNGIDPKKTLAIYTQPDKGFCRGSITYYGYYSLDEHEVSFQRIFELHMRLCPEDAHVDVQVATLYSIIGANKRRAEDIMQVKVRNSAYIETLTSEPDLHASTDNSYKLYLQVNVTNTDSTFYPLWAQLKTIKHLIDNLNYDDDLENIKIAQNPKTFHEVAKEITALLLNFKCKLIPQTKMNWLELDVLNMRQEDFLDKLWGCLMSLENLKYVEITMNGLFAELGEMPINYVVPSSNKSSLGVIVGDLVQRRMRVQPTLSMPVALQYLIELGLNKLNNDYIYLLEAVYPRAADFFGEQWEKLFQPDGTPPRGAPRKSRLTLTMVPEIKSARTEGALLKQLNHLAHMHLTMEFLRLSQRCSMGPGPETLIQVNERLLKCKDLVKSFKTLELANIVDFECDLSTNQFGLVTELQKVSINVRCFTQVRNKSSVTTIFHYSRQPLFPDVVFNAYDVDIKNPDAKKFYVHKADILVN